MLYQMLYRRMAVYSRFGQYPRKDDSQSLPDPETKLRSDELDSGSWRLLSLDRARIRNSDSF